MAALARWCIRHKKLVIGGWVALLLGLGAALGTAGTAFSDSTRLPASDSSTAYGLLAKAGNGAASAKTGTIVWRTDSDSAISPTTRSTIAPMLEQVSAVDGVAHVLSPFTPNGSVQVSKDGRTAYATVVFASTSHAKQAAHLAKEVSNARLTVQVGGNAFTDHMPSQASEIVGVLAALVVLLLVFRSLWAAALPIITGVTGVGVSTLTVMLLSHALTLPSVVTSMGALIGLGVGIDYALFIVNRQRKSLRGGADLTTAISTAMNTSGRAVIFAGGTVIIALLGMLVLNVGFLNGMAVSAALTVLITVAAAVTLLPALLASIGLKVLRRSDRKLQPLPAVDSSAEPGLWARWAAIVERRPLISSVLALAVLVVLAAPAVALRLGSADASSDPKGTSTRSYNDTMSRAFGAGFDSQLLLVAETPDQQARLAWDRLTTEIGHVDGVASVGSPTALSGGALSMVSVTPTTTAQARATSALVAELRSGVITGAESGTHLRVHVGGSTATSIDFARALTSKLPLFLLVIAALGFVLLALAFRSLLVPAIGAVGNLLTIAVALGTTVVLFQWGWGPAVFGIGGGAPLEYIVAVLIVGVVFGLSMDYHVFLVSRMHEEWNATSNNPRAVRVGAADTGRVIATAATIMACVFAAFGFAGVRVTSEFGVGLALAVLVDAFLLRMTLIPAVMHLCGKRNWAIPAWLDRAMPQLFIEGTATIPLSSELPTGEQLRQRVDVA